MVIQIVPLNIVKDGVCVITLTTVMALLDPGFQTVFGVALSTNVGISHDESGMTMDILFKPRIKATQRNS